MTNHDAPRVAVIGAGSWGTAVAALAAQNTEVSLWARDPVLARSIDVEHTNPTYLPGIELPAGIRATSDLVAASRDAAVIVMAVPSHGFRAVLTELRAIGVPDHVPIVSLAKGVEQGSQLRMTQVIAEVLGTHAPGTIGVLTGPNLAREVAEGQPTAAVIAFTDPETATRLQPVFMTRTFRVYTNSDVVGCELAGALKNVIAIAAGIAAGLGYGDNTKAALITRGLAELARLGVTLGGEPFTFSGLAGLGDLVATCTSEKSRNRTVGFQLGQGHSLDAIMAEMKMVAEGVKSTRSIVAIAGAAGVEMPIASAVDAVLDGREHVKDLVPALMLRQAKPERLGPA